MPQLMKGETWADAQKLVRGKPRFEYPIYVEVKADEIRCQVKYRLGTMGGMDTVEFLSYDEKPLHNLSGFAPEFLKFFKTFGPLMGVTELDIGIEVNGNFNDSYRWVRSSNGIPGEKFDKKTGKTAPALYEDMVNFIVFDLPENPNPFCWRMLDIDRAAQYMDDCGLRASRPTRRKCWNADEVMDVYREYRSDGHEGAMGKTLNHTYQRKRTYDWMKIKPKETLDGVITGINRAHTSVESVDEAGNIVPKGTPLDRAGSVSVRFENGSTADCGGLEHALAELMFRNPQDYIGQWAECERMEEDRQGGSRHPIFKRLREAKA